MKQPSKCAVENEVYKWIGEKLDVINPTSVISTIKTSVTCNKMQIPNVE